MPVFNDSEWYVTIESEQFGQTVVLKIVGRMDAVNSVDFEKACNGWIEKKITHIILDMSELAYVSSMGLRYFVNIGKVLQENGGSLRLSGVHGLVKQLFQITRLTNVFPMHETVADSLAAI